MTILEALQDPGLTDIRVSCGDRWLVCDDETDEFVVYSRPYGTRRTRVLIKTKNEDKAVAVLTDTQEDQP